MKPTVQASLDSKVFWMPTVPVFTATVRPSASPMSDDDATCSIDSVVSLATLGSIARLPPILCWNSTVPLSSVTFCTR